MDLRGSVGTWLEYNREPSWLHANMVKEYGENHALSVVSGDEQPASMSCGSKSSIRRSC